MSTEYYDYIIEHKDNVIKAYEWLRKNLGFDLDEKSLWNHDDSKYTSEEFDAYDAYFYGPEGTKEIEDQFNLAWLHHIHNNPHHWQYWVLINDSPEEGMTALDIPFKYVIEMICDWWSFSWKTGNLYEIFDWYNCHKKYMILSDNTRELVEEILCSIRKELDRQNNILQS